MVTNERETPCYVATCKECGGFMGAAVMDLSNTLIASDSLREAKRWQRGGLKVELLTVQAVREWPKDAMFSHAPTCSRYRRPKIERDADGVPTRMLL